ncbi:hypothetical protein AAG747_02945 [Rapidithrix thailandica]|uniref:Glycosyltransferase n=1 Tax=Rapidithrix thailandica TaxID=413964 RepID=A0AAW9RUV6_9BACT
MKIFLASVLKPLNDTRMYEKIGLSLSKSYEIHLMGYPAELPVRKGVYGYPLLDFAQGSRKRWQVGSFLLAKLKQVKPDVLVIHAVELLPVALYYRMFHKVRLIYDVQENYYRNFLYQSIYPKGIKHLMAWAVRGLETLSRNWVDYYWLAERCYAREFTFGKGKQLILENKSVLERQGPHLKSNSLSPPLRFVFTGTISTVYGAWEAVNLVKKLVDCGLSAELLMIGKVVEIPLEKELQKLEKAFSWFRLEGGSRLVPHTRILEALEEADVALLSYQPNKSTAQCIPTKLYECIAYRLPMIIPQNPLWEKICEEYTAALAIDFVNYNPKVLIEELLTKKFYNRGNFAKVLWKEEEHKLLRMMEPLVNQ